MADIKRDAYEAPEVVEYGDIDQVTKGALDIATDDVPLGASPPASGTVG